MTATRRPSRRTRLASAAVLAPLALGLTACGGDGDAEDDAPAAVVTVTASPSESTAGESTATTPSATAPSAPATPPAAGGGSLEAAAQTALGAVTGTVFTVDRDDDGGWEVSVIGSDGTDNEVVVAADGTTITQGPAVDEGDDGDDQAERQRLLGSTVTYLEAIAAAQGAVPGGLVTDVDLDEDDGTATWEVQVGGDGQGSNGSEATVDVDASTGDVLRTERED